MGEQFLQAWAVDVRALAAAIGSKDAQLVKRALKRELAEELRDVVEEDGDATLEEQLTAIVNGKPLDVADWHTLRCITLLADTLGSRVDDDLTLPGRGWQELGPAWKHWKLPAVAKLWSQPPRFVAKYDAWPSVMAAGAETLPKLAAELKAFDPSTIVELGVPKTVERFGEGEWPMDLLAGEISHLKDDLARCVKAATRKKKDLVLWLDGQQ